MITAEEKKNKQIGWGTTIIIHLLILLFFLLWKVWPFNPPLAPQYGIEVNFGTTEFGRGNVQTETAPSDTETEEVVEESSESEVVDEVSETAENQVVEATESSEEVIESNVESVVETAENTSEVEQTEVVEEVAEEVVESDSEKESDAENNTSASNTNNTSENNTSSQNNNGDDENETGDKGHEEGKVDAENLYGTPGGGDGFSTNIVGWAPDFAPKPKDTSNENGKIVFKVTIDDEGEIINIRTVEKTVSPAVEAIYRKEVEKLTFSKTGSNSIAAASSTGTITFLIRSK